MEQIILQALAIIGACIALIGTIWKGSSLIISNLERRNQKLTDELITAKTQILREQVEKLVIKLDKAEKDVEELKLRADGLRSDLDAEKAARIAESKRAARAEYLEATARKELEKKQIEVETLKSVLKMLSVSVPDGMVNISIVRTEEQKSTTDELTEAAKKVADEINNVKHE